MLKCNENCWFGHRFKLENGIRRTQIPRKPLDTPISWIVTQSLMLFVSLRPHRFVNDHFFGHLVVVYSSGADGRLRRWRFRVESPVTTKFYNCPADHNSNKKKLKNCLLLPGIDPTDSISRSSHIYQSSTLAQFIVGISCIYVWTTTALKDWLYFPTIKNRPVVYEKHWSGSHIRISIRITPNFELVLPMIITSLLTKFHQNPTSSLWGILLTNKQTNRQTHEGDCNIPLFAG